MQKNRTIKKLDTKDFGQFNFPLAVTKIATDDYCMEAKRKQKSVGLNQAFDILKMQKIDVGTGFL